MRLSPLYRIRIPILNVHFVISVSLVDSPAIHGIVIRYLV